MGLFDDIASALPDLAKAAVPVANMFMQQAQAQKQGKQMMRALGGSMRMGFAGGGMPMPGLAMGYGASPVVAPAGPSAMPGWMTALGVDPNSVGGMLGSYFGGGAPVAGGGGGLFSTPTGPMRPRPLPLVYAPNPVTGRLTWWRHVGQPILFRGDVTHCKQVNKLLGHGRRRFR